MGGFNVVESDAALRRFLDEIEECPIVPPSLYFDLEGIRLGRTGSISIISIFLRPLNKVYLIDVFIMRERAFLVSNKNQTSLKTILESSSIPKVFFDVRNDSDAMFSHYGIQLQGIKDLQVMELAVRSGSQQYLAGLAKCIERNANLSLQDIQKWKEVKGWVRQLWDPSRGGRYQVFEQRPLRADVAQYSVQDVVLLPRLWDVYRAKLCVLLDFF